MKAKEELKKIIAEKKLPMILFSLMFFLLTIWLIENKPTSRTQTGQAEEVKSIDTFIPAGFVLVPITIQNLESLDSIVGQFAVVDLYVAGENTALGRALKLIRSPNDPLQFAVLVPENDAQQVVQRSHKPFQVIIQNPEQKELTMRKTNKSKRISWED